MSCLKELENFTHLTYLILCTNELVNSIPAVEVSVEPPILAVVEHERDSSRLGQPNLVDVTGMMDSNLRSGVVDKMDDVNLDYVCS